MADNKEFCTQHSACEEKIRNMEKKVDSLETKITDDVNDCKNNFAKALDEFKKDTEKEIDGIKNSTSHLENVVNSLNVTIVRLESVVGDLINFMKDTKEEKKEKEKEEREKKKNWKNSFVYPLGIFIISFIIGTIFSKLNIKFK